MGMSRDNVLHNQRIGMKFNKLTILEYIGKGTYKCVCECGNITQSKFYNLQIGRTKSCGKCGHKITEKNETKSVYKDITNMKFGKLTALNYLGKGYWHCKCDCGNETDVMGTMLRCGNTKSCGCNKGQKAEDLSGQKFGEWTVKEYLGDSMWLCQCSCGTEKAVLAYTLKKGTSTCCGSPVHKYKDITNMQFGELTAKRYLGYGVWECKCSCGAVVNKLGANLRNGSSRSCGCKTLKFLQDTLMAKYGDINPARANNPRKCMDILLSKENFERLLDIYGTHKVSIDTLCQALDMHRNTVIKYINKFELNDRVQFNFGNTSRAEREVREVINKYNYDVMYNTKQIIAPYELDIYIPEKNIAIEFNGNYWHSTIYKDKKYHQEKTIACAKRGIRLIHIFEYEWNDENKREKLIKYIDDILNNTNNKIVYARECEIKEIEIAEAEEFINKNHLQRFVKSSIYLGLVYNNELIGCMTFGTPRFNHEYVYELHRLCWANGTRVVGGAEKLFRYFIKKYNPASIITYSDISKFTGNVYTRLGFKPIQPNPITEPSYVWVDTSDNIVLTRYQTQKQNLLEKGLGVKEQTEDEIMENLGYIKIYDCGNIKLEWKANAI